MAVSILQLLNLYYPLRVITARSILVRAMQMKVTTDLCKLVNFLTKIFEFSLDVTVNPVCVYTHTRTVESCILNECYLLKSASKNLS